MGWLEQLPRRRHTTPGERHLKRFLKHRVTKRRRQAERRDPENAPTKSAYDGWSD